MRYGVYTVTPPLFRSTIPLQIEGVPGYWAFVCNHLTGSIDRIEVVPWSKRADATWPRGVVDVQRVSVAKRP